MYHKTNKNKVNLFVRDCIQTATIELMKTKKYEDITVTEIINKSGVSRMGFYRNYKEKDGVIEDLILTLFQRTVEEIETVRPLNLSTYNIIETVLVNFQKYADYMSLFLDQKLDYLILECYKKAFYALYDGTRLTPMRRYYNEMFIANLYSLEMSWIRSGMKESPERLAKIYSYILTAQSKI